MQKKSRYMSRYYLIFAILSIEDNFSDFLFASLDQEILLQRKNMHLKEGILTFWD